jgi:hypothetical protein
VLEQRRVRAFLGAVGLQQRGRVDAEVPGVGAQEALGVDVAAQLVELFVFQGLEVAGADAGRGSGVLHGLPLRFPGRAQRFANAGQAGTPLHNAITGKPEDRLSGERIVTQRQADGNRLWGFSLR